MTRDDITRMARKAGFVGFDGDNGSLRRFAALVAAAEREAIAQMIEDAPPLVDFCKNEQNGCLVCGFTPKVAAAAIRARGQA
jgi:hypothetical protein